MSRSNRVDPVLTDRDVADLTRATMTTTTRMEFVRRVQVLPMVRNISIRNFFLEEYLHAERDFLLLIDYGQVDKRENRERENKFYFFFRLKQLLNCIVISINHLETKELSRQGFGLL